MCGLIGFATIEEKKIISKRMKWTETALYVSTLRGEDSTGVALIDKNTHETSLYKSPVPGWAFVTTKQFTKAASVLDDACVAIMHNRAATVGHISYENAHPFINGPVTMAHNGTLLSWDKKGHNTDSEWLCSLLASTTDTTAALENINGAYALSWFDKRDGSLNLARNSQRPLAYVISKNGKFVAWASEPWMIAAACDRSGWYETKDLGAVVVVEPGHLHKFYMDRSLKPTVSKFESYSPPTYGYYGSGYNNGYRGTTYNSSNYTKNYNVVQLPGPKSKSSNEFEVGKEVLFIVDQATPTNGLDIIIEGQVITNNPMYVEAVYNYLPKKLWSRYKHVKDPVFSGKISVSVSYEDQGMQCLRLTLRDVKYVSSYSKYLKSPGAIDIYAAEESASNEASSTISYIPGPGGILLSEEEFEALVEDGCSNCTSPIDLVETLKYKNDPVMQLRWTREQLPLCSSCYNSPIGREIAN